MDVRSRENRIYSVERIRNEVIRDQIEGQHNRRTPFKLCSCEISGSGETPNEALRWNPPGRKKRGRLTKTWLYGVLEHMK